MARRTGKRFANRHQRRCSRACDPCTSLSCPGSSSQGTQPGGLVGHADQRRINCLGGWAADQADIQVPNLRLVRFGRHDVTNRHCHLRTSVHQRRLSRWSSAPFRRHGTRSHAGSSASGVRVHSISAKAGGKPIARPKLIFNRGRRPPRPASVGTGGRSCRRRQWRRRDGMSIEACSSIAILMCASVRATGNRMNSRDVEASGTSLARRWLDVRTRSGMCSHL